VVHIAFSYVVKGGRKLRKDTKTHQDRYMAIDPVTCALIQDTLDEVGVTIPASAYLFSNDPAHARPWNPDWVTHRLGDLARAAGVNLDIKTIRHYNASQMLAEGFDLGNTAARLGHSGGGATTLKHYADPVSEVDRRAAVRLAQLTSGSAGQRGFKRAPAGEAASAGFMIVPAGWLAHRGAPGLRCVMASCP
jgi:integrase